MRIREYSRIFANIREYHEYREYREYRDYLRIFGNFFDQIFANIREYSRISRIFANICEYFVKKIFAIIREYSRILGFFHEYSLLFANIKINIRDTSSFYARSQKRQKMAKMGYFA